MTTAEKELLEGSLNTTAIVLLKLDKPDLSKQTFYAAVSIFASAMADKVTETVS